MNNAPTLAFIGTGNMASAIISGLIKMDFPVTNIWASSPNIDNKESLKKTGMHLTTDNKTAVKHADIIVLAVKPHQIQSVCGEIKSITENKLVISVAAGVSIHTIQKALDSKKTAVVRVMPNIAATVSASATGLYANDSVSQSQKDQVETLFRSIGTTVWATSEDQFNAITAVAGSGPAYSLYLFEAMQAAAEEIGIDKETAKLLIAETATGAAKIALESSDDFDQIRKRVTSPNGTTQAATDYMTQHDFKKTIKNAVKAAFSRAKELDT